MHVLTPGEAADRLVAGAQRHRLGSVRLGYGEPGLHWPHVTDVITEALARTRAQRTRVVVETNGAHLTPALLDDLETQHGPVAARVFLTIGAKATTPEQLAALTGLSADEAARAHQAQLDAIMHIAHACEHLGLYVTFLDRYTDPHVLAGIVRAVEHARPGLTRNIHVIDYQLAASGRRR